MMYNQPIEILAEIEINGKLSLDADENENGILLAYHILPIGTILK